MQRARVGWLAVLFYAYGALTKQPRALYGLCLCAGASAKIIYAALKFDEITSLCWP